MIFSGWDFITDRVADWLRPFSFKGKGRLLNFLTRQNRLVTSEIFGSRMNLDLSDYIQRNVHLGTFEPFETRIIRDYLKPGMVFVDVGANVGYFTALGASRVGRYGRVLAIEPSPQMGAALEELVQANHLSQVKFESVGVGAANETLTLFIPDADLHNHTPTMMPQTGAVPVEVQVVTLDSLTESNGIERIDLLKIDIEGFEMAAFLGASRLLSEGRISAIVCEFNDYWLREAKQSPDSLYQFLVDAGFRSTGGRPVFSAGSVVTCFFRRDLNN